MTKIETISPIASISGKLHKDDDFYLATKRKTGTVYMVNRRHEFHGPWSEKQQEHRKAFAERSHTASAWLKENDPKHVGGKGTEAYQRMIVRYRAQHKISNIFAFVAKHYYDGVIEF